MNSLYAVIIYDEGGNEYQSFNSMKEVKDFILLRLNEYIEDEDEDDLIKIEIRHTTKGK